MASLGIIAGGGKLPELLVENSITTGTNFHVISFKGQAFPTFSIPEANHTVCGIAKVGKVISTFRNAGISRIVMAGGLQKPSILNLIPDATGAKLIASLKGFSDDLLLSGICSFLASEGFEIVGVHEILPELIACKGSYGKCTPTDHDLMDIKIAAIAARELGLCDIGQGAIVKDGVVLGLEDENGTDALIKHCASLRGAGNSGGVLVKCAKPQQNLKVDMPACGINTINNLVKYNYTGIAVEAGKTLIVGENELIKIADRAGIFVYGI